MPDEDVTNRDGVFEQPVFGVAPLGAAAAVARLFDDIEKRVFFQEVSSAAQRKWCWTAGRWEGVSRTHLSLAREDPHCQPRIAFVRVEGNAM